jgi:hypothetical protein
VGMMPPRFIGKDTVPPGTDSSQGSDDDR